jgi:iron(III) transport system substrate-binding protein
MRTRGCDRSRTRLRSVAIALAGVLLIAACGSDGDGDSQSAADGNGSGGDGSASNAPANEDSEWQQLLTELQTMPLEELHEKALEEEDGQVIYWNGNSVIPADRAGVGPVFEEAFPGMHVTLFGEGQTGEMITRIKAERDAGLQPSGDLLWASFEHATDAHDQGVVADWSPPEAEPYPDDMKGSFYVAVNKTFHGIVWNTNNVSEDEAPTSYDDLLDPRWDGRIIAEPRIATQLTALAVHRFEDEDTAREYSEDLAAEDVTFIPRYPTLVQQLASGEHDICFNCNLFNTWELQQDGAPLEVLESEAMALPDAQLIFADPPHPYGAMLMARWMISEDGQRALAAGHKSPVLPAVAGTEDAIVPETQYPLLPEDATDAFPSWDEFAAEAFDLR